MKKIEKARSGVYYYYCYQIKEGKSLNYLLALRGCRMFKVHAKLMNLTMKYKLNIATKNKTTIFRKRCFVFKQD